MKSRVDAMSSDGIIADFKRYYYIADSENFNFAFDVVGKRAREADKLAILAIDRTGERVERLTYADLDRESNRFANVLTVLGFDKGEFTVVMIARKPAWFHVLMGWLKYGRAAMS